MHISTYTKFAFTKLVKVQAGLFLFGIAVFVICSLAIPGRSANQPDRSTPEKTIRSFVAALNAADLKEAAACVAGAKPTAKGLPEMWRISNQMFKRKYSIEQLQVSMNKNQATAQLQVRVRIDDESVSRAERLQLRQDKGQWEIVAPAVTTSSQPLGLLGDQVYLLAHPEMFVEVFNTARGNARRIVCTNQVKELALAARKLAQGHQGRLVVENRELKKTLMPYTKKDIFRCGADHAGAVSYSFNHNLKNIALNKIKNPAKTVFIYEGAGGQLNFRHKRARIRLPLAIVAFVDGHVEEVNAEQVAGLKWKP